jgi:hypothetical protein
MIHESKGAARERGAVLVMSLIILFLATAAGIILLRLAQVETTNNVSDRRSKQAFFMAEGAIERGRDELRIYRTANKSISVVGKLQAVAGTNGTINATDPTAIGVTFDSTGVPTALTGLGDDQPLRGITSYGSGWYATLMTNDLAESGGRATANTDTNKRVMLIGIGIGPDRSIEMVEAVADTGPDMPTPPATITMLGDAPHFDAGGSGAKQYFGDDCRGLGLSGYPPGLGSFDVIGVTTDAALAVVDADILGMSNSKQQDINSGSAGYPGPAEWGTGTTENITVSNPWYAAYPEFQDCSKMVALANIVRDMADRIIPAPSSGTVRLTGDLGTADVPRIIYCEGNCSLRAPATGYGVLFVRGDLTFDGQIEWYGQVYVVGSGQLFRQGAGGGNVYGSIIIANTVNDTCTGTSTGGFGVGAQYDMSGGGNSVTAYCSYYNKLAWIGSPVNLKSFRQY